MKESSHFLRNIGYRGYAILDKHILRGLHELGVIDEPARPSSPARYREIETRLLKGDPTHPGLYTISIKVPAGTRISAHTHRDDRSAVVPCRSSFGAPLRRKVHDSINVLSAAIGRATRTAVIAPLIVRLG